MRWLGVVAFLVEYDLPAGKYRLRFYRGLKKLLDGREGLVERSTQSVIITGSKGLAEEIADLALRCGGKVKVWRLIEEAEE